MNNELCYYRVNHSILFKTKAYTELMKNDKEYVKFTKYRQYLKLLQASFIPGYHKEFWDVSSGFIYHYFSKSKCITMELVVEIEDMIKHYFNQYVTNFPSELDESDMVIVNKFIYKRKLHLLEIKNRDKILSKIDYNHYNQIFLDSSSTNNLSFYLHGILTYIVFTINYLFQNEPIIKYAYFKNGEIITVKKQKEEIKISVTLNRSAIDNG